MNKTSENNTLAFQRIAVDTKALAEILSCGKVTAIKIGETAGAKIKIGKRVLWNVSKIQAYLDTISE